MLILPLTSIWISASLLPKLGSVRATQLVPNAHVADLHQPLYRNGAHEPTQVLEGDDLNEQLSPRSVTSMWNKLDIPERDVFTRQLTPYEMNIESDSLQVVRRALEGLPSLSGEVVPRAPDDPQRCPISLVGDRGKSWEFLDRRGWEDTIILSLWKRIKDGDISKRAFPIDPSDSRFFVIAQFLESLYRSRWINQEQIQRTVAEATLHAIGPSQLTPMANEPVADPRNSRWRISEGWRPINVFRLLLAYARQGISNPVRALMDQQGTGALNLVAVPMALRNLLIANEAAIIAGAEPWVGRNGRTTIPPGVRSAYAANRLGFYQEGSMGPFPLEVSFILATQMAGINFAQVAPGVNRPLHWLNAMVPRGTGINALSQCLRSYVPGREFDPNPASSRRMGFLTRAGVNTGDPDAGFYVVIDVDGQQDLDANPQRNVFVFAVHTIDPHSRVNVPDKSVLRSLTYTQFDPAGTSGAPEGPSTRASQRYFAHAHAAWVPYAQMRDFMTQDHNSANRVPFPVYHQIGRFHFYILSEDEDAIHPRRSYLDDPEGGRKYDQ